MGVVSGSMAGSEQKAQRTGVKNALAGGKVPVGGRGGRFPPAGLCLILELWVPCRGTQEQGCRREMPRLISER